METRNLIRAIAVDTAGQLTPLQRVWSLSTLLAVAFAAFIFFLLLGVRSDFFEALRSTRFLFKFVLTGSVVTSAYFAVRALSRPEGPTLSATLPLFSAPTLLGAAILLELSAVQSSLWATRLVGSNSIVCLTYIPVIGAGPLILFVGTLRYGAPKYPALAGAVAGVLAGSISATFYAAQCTDDSPLFVSVWYTIAIAVLAVIGALTASRYASW